MYKFWNLIISDEKQPSMLSLSSQMIVIVRALIVVTAVWEERMGSMVVRWGRQHCLLDLRVHYIYVSIGFKIIDEINIPERICAALILLC